MSRRVDSIRAMNTEELAELLDDIADDAFQLAHDDEHLPTYPIDKASFFAWLLEEVDE